jgi:hypothetical protein
MNDELHADPIEQDDHHEPDREFHRAMCIARTRWLLEAEARRLIAQLRREGEPIRREILANRLILAVLDARPQSRLVAWNLPDAVVEKIVKRVAEGFA